MTAFSESRVAVIDYCDDRDSLSLDSPCRVRLHLKKPNIGIDTAVQEMLDPAKVAWRLRVQYGGRHQLHGRTFMADTRGKAQKRWQEILEEAAIAIDGRVKGLADDGSTVTIPVDEALRELR